MAVRQSYRDRAIAMLRVLRAKGTIDLYDVMLQFDVSYPTAFHIYKLTKKLCEASNECTESNGKLIYIGQEEEQVAVPAEDQHEEELAGQPAEKEEAEHQPQGRSIDEVSPEELFEAKPHRQLPDVADRKGTVIVKTDEEQPQ